jgi:hypothetical protein
MKHAKIAVGLQKISYKSFYLLLDYDILAMVII